MSTNNILINIKKIRELNHISRDEIAKKLNMGTSGYSKIERGEVEVTIRKFEQIALILGHSMSEIIEFDIAKLAAKTKPVFIKKNSIQDKRIKSDSHHLRKSCSVWCRNSVIRNGRRTDWAVF